MPMRTSLVAGRFFPEDKDALGAAVTDLLQKTDSFRTLFPDTPRAVIAPHAGYGFSGALTAAAWALTARATPARIAILSPAHRKAFDGLVVPTGHGAVALPGMRVKIDKQACKALIRARRAIGMDEAFEQEHGIDIHLPFARHVHPGVPVVPVIIGAATEGQVAAAIDRLDKLDGETLFILSSDLSHFLSQDQAQRIDLQTAGLIETGQGARITPAHACGARAIAGWLASNAGAGSRAVRMGKFTSFNANKDDSRVVGYGTWGLFDATSQVLCDTFRQELLGAARKAMAAYLRSATQPTIKLDSFPMPLRTIAASFVTLQSKGQLRGCIGSLAAHRPLIADVVGNAVKAGFQDKRFKPLTAAELEQCEISISVLTRPAPLEIADEASLIKALKPGQSGLILADGEKRGLFLPSVWASIPDPAEFVTALKRKAGLDPDHWSDTLTIQSFRSEAFGEDMMAQARAA